jgi:CheY-like chemotaxis protein
LQLDGVRGPISTQGDLLFRMKSGRSAPVSFPAHPQTPTPRGAFSRLSFWHRSCKMFTAMKHILLCSSDRLLVKNLYGVLRDRGLSVDTVEHPSHAVRLALGKRYAAAIMDIEPFGLSSVEAREILRSVAPEMPVLTLGTGLHSLPDRARELEAVARAMGEYAA